MASILACHDAAPTMGMRHVSTRLCITMINRISVLIAPVVIVLLFGPTLIGVDRLAFRDVSHFYLPLYDYVAERCSREWLPLWNPLDQTGMPLVGETTTAVLYPIRYAVFALPIPSDVALNWYIVLHLVLASLTSRWAAIRSGAGPMAATLAGVIYPLSGSVLFLYSNPPFLVGAAWLPLVLAALITREQMAGLTRCLIAAPSMAMMILGGDPQAALHAMLVAATVVVVRGARHGMKSNQRNIAFAVFVAPALAALLAAPQIAASLSWSSQSDRLHAIDNRAWHEPPAQGSHRHNAMEFSLPPWHAASLLSPNVAGRLFPTNQRISVFLSGDGRMWTPSVYLGLLAALAIISRLMHRKWDVWIAISVVSFLMSMGHFGLVWVLQQIPGVLPNVDSAIGGPYWLLYWGLPGYDSFRYPVKWLPFFFAWGCRHNRLVDREFELDAAAENLVCLRDSDRRMRRRHLDHHTPNRSASRAGRYLLGTVRHCRRGPTNPLVARPYGRHVGTARLRVASCCSNSVSAGDGVSDRIRCDRPGHRRPPDDRNSEQAGCVQLDRRGGAKANRCPLDANKSRRCMAAILAGTLGCQSRGRGRRR